MLETIFKRNYLKKHDSDLKRRSDGKNW